MSHPLCIIVSMRNNSIRLAVSIFAVVVFVSSCANDTDTVYVPQATRESPSPKADRLVTGNEHDCWAEGGSYFYYKYESGGGWSPPHITSVCIFANPNGSTGPDLFQ